MSDQHAEEGDRGAGHPAPGEAADTAAGKGAQPGLMDQHGAAQRDRQGAEPPPGGGGPGDPPAEGSGSGDDDDDERAFDRPSGRFGRPGRPLRRSPFLIGFTGGLGVLLAYAFYLGLRNAASMLILVFIGLFLAIGLNPAVVRLRAWGLPRGLAVTAVILTVLLLLCGGLVALVPPLVTQTGEFIDKLPSLIESLQSNPTIRDLIERYDLMERARNAASTQNVTAAVGGLFGGARLIFGTVFNVLTVLVLTIYFLAAFDRIKGAGYRLVPASRRERAQLIGDEILLKVGAYMVGALAIAVLAGVSTFAFAIIVDLKYPFALAVVVAVCDLIPQIGATLGAVIVSIVGFTTSVPAGIACVIFFVVYQQIENYLIYPKVMRRSVQVSDVAAIVAALLGVALFGVIGALVAIPMVAAIQLIVREVVEPAQQKR